MTPPLALDPDLAQRLRGATRNVRFSRQQFGAFYDDWLANRRLPDAPSGFVHAVMAACEDQGDLPEPLRPGDDADALCLALAALGAPAHMLECFTAAVAAGIFDGAVQAGARAAQRRDLMHAMRQALLGVDARAILHASTRHALPSADAFWTDPGDLLPAILLARRRMCKILTVDENEDPVTGSGFLIGPSSVLTNFHVVRHLAMPLDEPGRLRVQFDFSETTGLENSQESIFRVRPDWRIQHSGLGDGGPDQDYWWDDAARRNAWLDLVQSDLDYAVLHLDGAPGLQRGWYSLDPGGRGKPTGVWVLHHPGQEQHTISTGAVKLTKRGGHRIFHLAATVPGSSGGLVLDEQGAPVGLHYLGLEARAEPQAAGQNHKVLNVAVSLAAIAADLQAKGRLATIGEPNGIGPYRGCLDGKRPVFGRKDFVRLLERLWRGERQMLMVHPPPPDTSVLRPGKSFSAEILQALFRAPENHHILFRAGEIAHDAYRVAADTVSTFAASEVGRLPAKPDTTTPAYVRRLLGKVVQIMEERLSNKLVWITLDDLDRHDLSDASGREFLATLYNQIKRLPNLRVVLIGLPETITINGMDERDVLRSRIAVQEPAELGATLTNWLLERGGREEALTDGALRFFADILTSVAQADAPLEALSEFVARHVTPAADNLFGAASRPEAEGPQ